MARLPAKPAAGGAAKNARRKVLAPIDHKFRLMPRSEYRIYPSIGVARVGDSADGYYIGPEAPGIAPAGPFRGKDKGLVPQAARFRIYKVDIDELGNEKVIEEIVASGSTRIEWTVTLANRKAAAAQIHNKAHGDGGTLARSPKPALRNAGMDRNKLVIAATQSVAGRKTAAPVLAGDIEFAKPHKSGPKETGIVLARLATDEAGRLLVIGGPGKSGTPMNTTLPVFADNDGWYDSVSDGPVSAKLTIDGKAVDVVPAWALVTVPRYAPGIYGIVTWHDQAVNMARTNPNGAFTPPRSTSFTRDIYPVLKRADMLAAVHASTHSTTAPALSSAAAIASYATPGNRSKIFARLTPVGAAAPDYQTLPATSPNMPLLFSGANPDPNGPVWTYLALTRYQYAHFQNWAVGNFDADWPGSAPTPPPFDKIPVAKQAWALTEAALTACVGGSFFPGIEATYDMARAATYHPLSYLRQEFRIDPAKPAGFLTEKMALPWQADFADCNVWWWPSQRPVHVMANGAKALWDRGVGAINDDTRHQNMAANWSKLGFVTRDPASGAFVETDRTLDEPAIS